MEGRAVLVTGASSGVGEALVRPLACDRRTLVLAARRAGRLEALAVEGPRDHGVRAEVVPSDLAQPGAAARLVAEVGSRGLVVDWLVNDADFGTHGHFWELPVARELEEIARDVEAPVARTGRCLPGMVARQRGVVAGTVNRLLVTPAKLLPRALVTRIGRRVLRPREE